jgi:membrane-associated phospholipid phosphatase
VVAAAFGSHALSVIIKRIIRRHRPHDPRVNVHVKTPSELSFPSSHASSTTAATVLIGRLIGFPVQLFMVPIMLLSRLVLGVHYPSDVITGAILGTVTAESVFSAESMLDTRCKRKSGQK